MIPSIETVRHDQKVENEYAELNARRRELNVQLGEVTGEMNKILATLGELVASGVRYKKHTDRLAALRSESEALEQGISYLDGQIELMKRSNYGLKTR